MTNGWLYEVFKIIVGNFSLVLFLAVATYKLVKKIETHFVFLQGMERRLDCIVKQVETMEKQFEEHRGRSEKILSLLPKRERNC